MPNREEIPTHRALVRIPPATNAAISSRQRARIVRALARHGGNIQLAANQLGWHRSTLYRKIDASPELQDDLRDIDELEKDFAEGQHRAHRKAGNLRAIETYLKKKAPERGWSDHVVVTGENSGAIVIAFPMSERDARL